MDVKILDLSDLSDHPSEASEDDKEELEKINQNTPNKKQFKIFNDMYLLNKTRFFIVEQSISELQAICSNQTISNEDNRDTEMRRQKAIKNGNETLQQIRETLDDCKAILDKLKQSEEEAWNNENKDFYGTYSLDYRVCLEQYTQMQKTFISIGQTFADVSGNAKLAIEGRIKRLLQVVHNNYQDNERIDQIIDSGDMECIQKLLQATESEFDQILNGAIEKNAQSQQIYKTIEEIRRMAFNQAVMLQQQSEQIDRIQDSVNIARVNVQKGVQNLVKANKSAKAHKRCVCCSICIFAVIAIIILIVVVSVISK